MQTSVISIPAHWSTVFNTKNGCVFQSDSEKCWHIDFGGEIKKFDYRCLLKLKNAVYQIDLNQLLLSQSTCADIEIVSICACAHCYVLSFLELIALKELLQGTFAMLELNHIIYDRLYRIVA